MCARPVNKSEAVNISFTYHMRTYDVAHIQHHLHQHTTRGGVFCLCVHAHISQTHTYNFIQAYTIGSACHTRAACASTHRMPGGRLLKKATNICASSTTDGVRAHFCHRAWKERTNAANMNARFRITFICKSQIYII